jgi:uncharacterized protein YjeT (DUF2065 family)
MRAVLSLIVSLAMAIALCLLLVAGGVLEFGDNKAATRIKAVTKRSENLLLQFARKVGSLPKAVNRSVPSHTHKTPSQSDAPIKENPSKNHNATVKEKRTIYLKALEFLRSWKNSDSADVEDEFVLFLKVKFRLDQDGIDKLVRMSFWKNFVTLQQPLRADDMGGIETAFAQEKELKKAGFAAKGLTLLPSEVHKAEAHLREILQGESL